MKVNHFGIECEEFELTQEQKEGMIWLHSKVNDYFGSTNKQCMLIAQIDNDNICKVSFIPYEKAIRIQAIVLEKE